MTKVLFILKGTQPDYSCIGGGKIRPAGLANSARFVVEMINAEKLAEAKMVHVVDNNDIDREVSLFKPDKVIIEALWVVPEKFLTLRALHPGVEWIVRLHSETPFLATEGVAIAWVKGYVQNGVKVASNSVRLFKDLSLDALLPNYYPLSVIRIPRHGHGLEALSFGVPLHVGCFGAIRPLKNHLTQAIAALKYAEKRNFALNFYVNVTGADQNILKNLRALFNGGVNKLVEIGWLGHDEFLDIMSRMDVHLQVSLSETFNITSADAVASGIPIVVSPEVAWAAKQSKANPNSVESIIKGIERVLTPSFWTKPHNKNYKLLKAFDQKSSATWAEFLK